MSLSRSDAEGRACIIVTTIQSFRRTTDEGKPNPDGLKLYKDAGALMSHFSGLTEEQRARLDCVEGTKRPIASLANLLKLHRPMVIVDEAHNARTDLSFETLARFTPSLILEMTATPVIENEHPSNILSSVSAAELKVEEMIKMPIELTTNIDWQQTVGAALDCQIELEKKAKEEEKQTGEYIRPIILFQAQSNTGPAPITHDKLKKFLIEDKHIAEEHIAVHTGSYKDLDDINIEDPECPVRYVITVQKLKEGWDCPFAYILCSMAIQSSTTAVEQILGRVLRMPKAKRKQNESLNASYAYIASAEFDKAASQLRDGLVKGAGFEQLEANSMIKAQPEFSLGKNPQAASPSLFAEPERKEEFRVPLLAFNNQGKLELFISDHFLNLPWHLEESDATKIDGFFTVRSDAQSGQLDVSNEGDVKITFAEHVQTQLAGVIYEPSWTKERLVAWLCRRIQHQDVTLPSCITFYNRIVDHLLPRQYSLAELARHKYRLRDAVKNYVSSLRKVRQECNYDALFAMRADQFALSADHFVIFDEQHYSYNQPYKGARVFNKHLTSIVGDLDAYGEEFECACYLDSLDQVKYWIRNVDRKLNAFWLQLPQNKFYPDFVALLKDGRILVVEYKGLDRYESAEEKMFIGNYWAEISDGKCLFCMPTDRNFDLIKNTIEK